MQEIETLNKGNKILRIYIDEDPQDPREWDNLGKFILRHKRYTFPKELEGFNFEDYENKEECIKALQVKFKALIIKPIYLLDHSGLWLKTSRFIEDPQGWDTSFIGFLIATEEDIIKEFDKIDKDILDKVNKILDGEIEIYNSWLHGSVYGFILTKKIKVKITKDYKGKKKQVINTTEEEEINSCWGFFGEEGIKQIKEECKFN